MFLEQLVRFNNFGVKTQEHVRALADHVTSKTELYLFRMTASRYTMRIYDYVLEETKSIQARLGLDSLRWNFPLEADLKQPIEAHEVNAFDYILHKMDYLCHYHVFDDRHKVAEERPNPWKFMVGDTRTFGDDVKPCAWVYQNIPEGGNAMVWAVRSRSEYFVSELVKRNHVPPAGPVLDALSAIDDWQVISPMLDSLRYLAIYNLLFGDWFDMEELLLNCVKNNDSKKIEDLRENKYNTLYHFFEGVDLDKVADAYTFVAWNRDFLSTLLSLFTDKDKGVLLAKIIMTVQDPEIFDNPKNHISSTIDGFFWVFCDTVVQDLCAEGKFETLIGLIRLNPRFIKMSSEKKRPGKISVSETIELEYLEVTHGNAVSEFLELVKSDESVRMRMVFRIAKLSSRDRFALQKRLRNPTDRDNEIEIELVTSLVTIILLSEN